MIDKSEIPYHELDSNIVNLCKAINAFQGVITVESCGGHQDPRPFQLPAGAWEVFFHIEHSEQGWFDLEFLAWAVTRNSAVHARIEAGAPPPYLNNPGQCLYFVLEGKGDPDQLAEWINRQRKCSYFSPLMLDLEESVLKPENSGTATGAPPVGLHMVRLLGNAVAREFDLSRSEDVADLADFLSELERKAALLDSDQSPQPSVKWMLGID